MRDGTATPRERPEIEQAPVITHGQDQQIRDWIMIHKLEACRVCGAFRIDDLGLTELRSALRSRRQALGSRS